MKVERQAPSGQLADDGLRVVAQKAQIEHGFVSSYGEPIGRWNIDTLTPAQRRTTMLNPDQLQLEVQGHLRAGQTRQALQKAADLLQQQPDVASGWRLYGQVLLKIQQHEQAAETLQRACELDPEDIDTRSSLGELYQSIGSVDEAIHWHGQALALAPHSLSLALNHAFVWPRVPDSVSQIQDCRDRCREAFDRLRSDELLSVHPSHRVTVHTFEMAYHGFDDRLWLEEYAELLKLHLTPEKPSVFPGEMQRRSTKGRRLRLGFLSHFFGNHTNSQAFEGLITAINRERFVPVLIHAHAQPDHPEHQRMNQLADQVVYLPVDVDLSRRQLSALKLDLLYFTDVGMAAMIYPLLAQQSAPVQMSGWGFPRTSGHSTIDYYLSGSLVEPVNGEDHYTETLIRLHGLPCRFLSRELAMDEQAAAMGRRYFLLPEDRPLVGILQHLPKLHPDLDRVMELIACAIPDVGFVLVTNVNPLLLERYLERLNRTAPMAAERIMPLMGMAQNQFSALAGCVDVQLDSPHFGCGISFYQTIHTGTPMLTTEGPYLRSRYASGGYRLMELEDPPVAADLAGMADLAINLLKDPDRLKALKQRIKAASPKLYDRMDVVHSFEDFAMEAVARANRS